MVSTSGRGPRLAASIRQGIENSLPPNVERAIERTGTLRAGLRKIAPGVGGPLGARRMGWMINVCDEWSLDELAEMDDEMEARVLEGWESGEVRRWEDVVWGGTVWSRVAAKYWKNGRALGRAMGGAVPLVGGLAIGVVGTLLVVKRSIRA